jgi:hypothetical protein
MDKRTVYNLADAGPEVRSRVAQARNSIARIVSDLNMFLADKSLVMIFNTSVKEVENRRPASATLKAWLKCGLVKPEEMTSHLKEIAEAEARELRHQRAKDRRC